MVKKPNNSDFEINQNPNGLRNFLIVIIVLFLLIVGASLSDMSKPTNIVPFFAILIGSGFCCFFICTGKIGNYNVFKRKFEEDIPTLLERRYGKKFSGDLVKAYLSDGDYPKAILQLETELSIHPDNVLIMLWLAEANEYVGNKDNAIRLYKNAIQHSNSSERNYFESELQRLETHGCKNPGMAGLRHMTW